MKKLTAGILASLIGLVSANSAEAAVASTNYVDEGLATKQDTLNATNVVADPNASSGNFVTSVTAENGTVTVSYGDLDVTEYAEGNMITFSEGTGENAGKTLINAVEYVEGTNVNIEEGTGENAGKMVVNVDVTEYAEGENVTFTEGTGENAGKTVINSDQLGGITTYGDKEEVTEAGWQTLTRKCTDLTDASTCSYEWETIYREYSADTQQ